jgi:hypothetical protein
MNKVCSFSGFTECYNKEGNRVWKRNNLL